MDWYIPITMFPAAGLLILSTTAQMMNLSAEIGGILSDKCTLFEHRISALKIKQLKLLTRATALLYIAAACFILSGIVGAVLAESMGISEGSLPRLILMLGVTLVLIALGYLIVYGYRTIGIRQLQHEFNPSMDEEGGLE